MEKIKDLLLTDNGPNSSSKGSSNVLIRESRNNEVNLVGVTEYIVKTKEECYALLKSGRGRLDCVCFCSCTVLSVCVCNLLLCAIDIYSSSYRLQ